MIFILEESTMNGTVTISTNVVGVEARSFDEAVGKVKTKLLGLIVEAKVHKDDAWAFGYSIQSDFPIIGKLTCKPLKMMEETTPPNH